MTNLVNAIAGSGGSGVRVLVEEITRLEQEKVTLTTRLEHWNFLQQCSVTEAGLRQMIAQERETLLRGTPQERKGAVQLFIEQVLVSAETITAEYVIKTSGLPDDCASKWWRGSI